MQMLLPFRLGLGGRTGSGRQYWSWIAMKDAVEAIGWALGNERLSGPVNVASPHPVTNRQFAAALGRALHRPAVCLLPAFIARLAFGPMADELLLGSTRVEPAKLLESGFVFDFPKLDMALNDMLG